MKTLNLAEAAEFLKMHVEEVRRRAKAGKIPGAKPGKSWVFILEDLAEYIRSHYADSWQALRVVAEKEEKLCHSINAVKRGGSRLPHQQESVLDVLLAQPTKTQAQEYHDQLKAESWRTRRLGEKPKHTWDEAACKFLLETQYKATHERDKEKLRWLQQFLRNKPLHEINRELIDYIAQTKANETSPSTANRYLALIRAILRKACNDWEWLDKIPKIRLFPEPKRRIRWLTPEQVKKLLSELPQHQQDMMIFALSTGLRQSNIINLEWSQLDLDRKVAWIHPDQAKARKAIHVPLNSVAMTVLLRQIGKHSSRVFTFRGNPIAWINTKAWKHALKRAGIENFRWHDLRHTWASWLAQQGTPMNVLQELGGWESEEMVRRYAHLSKPQLMQHAELVSNVLNDTILSHQNEKRG